MRIEKDSIGRLEIPKEALYGIHALRARNNFPDETAFHMEWYQAMALVKRACYLTCIDFITKAEQKYNLADFSLKLPGKEQLAVLIASAQECETGKHIENFIVPAISGGAGTSINMNVNEILTNRALQKLNTEPGNYQYLDPIEHANIFQSTNDVVPTALTVATMQLLNKLEDAINQLRFAMEEKEKTYRDVLRIGYTQMQEAVPTTYGRLFSAFSDTLSRDWWRVSKCFERIKVVNLGGSAIGTSVAVPRYVVLEVVRVLQQISDLPVTRGENLSDATSNLDSLVEVHGILKAHAVNLEKMANDLRLLSSDMQGPGKMSIPQKQAGSSIMPGKINPVIIEFIISGVHKVYANDQLITQLSAQGCLELNAYLPVIGHAMLESLKILLACNQTATENLVKGLEINAEQEKNKVLSSPSTATILLPYIGYNQAGELAKYMKTNSVDILTANEELNLVETDLLNQLLNPENLVQGGYTLKDMLEQKKRK